MAQHPFGPIENQLIVGYYKRGFSPFRLCPVEKSSKIMTWFDGQSHLFNTLEKPVFYGWSPANGNSSSHDFRVERYIFQKDSWRYDLNLLSRGLGYRITFTMPEQEIRTEDPSSWPTCNFKILDFWGKQLSTEISIKFDRDLLERYLIEILRGYQSLQYEHTHFYTKIVENTNQMETFLFPVYRPPGSSLDERHLAAAERHRGLLGNYARSKPTYSKDHHDRSLDHLHRTFSLLQSELETLDATRKLTIHKDLEAAAATLARFCGLVAEGNEEEIRSVKPLVERLRDNLESDIRKWLDDEGPFPRYISVNAIKESWNNNYARRRLLYHRPEQIFDALGIFYPKVLEDLIKGHFLSSQRISAEKIQQSITFTTKNFTIIVENKTRNFQGQLGKSTLSFYKTSEGQQAARRLIGRDGQPIMHYRLLCVSESILCCEPPEFFYIIELQRLWSGEGFDHKNKPHEQYFQLPHVPRDQFDMPYFFIGCNAKLSFSRNGRDGLFFYYPLDESSPFQLKDWQRTSFEVNTAIRRNGASDMQLSSCKNRVYLSLECVPSTQSILFALLSRNKPTETFELTKEKVFPLELGSQGFNVRWLKLRQNRVFACAFTPDCRLWAFMYWKEEFIRAGSTRNQKSLFRPFGSRWDRIRLMQGLAGGAGAGLLGYKRTQAQADGKAEYRFSYITFACK